MQEVTYEANDHPNITENSLLLYFVAFIYPNVPPNKITVINLSPEPTCII